MKTDTTAEHLITGWRVGDAGHTIFGPRKHDGSSPEIIATVRKSANARLIAMHDDLVSALTGVLHHNDAVKPEYKLPDSLVRHIMRVLE